MFAKTLVATLSGVAFASTTAPGGKLAVLDESFDQVAEQLLERYHVPGISVAVVYDGEIVAKGYGYSELPSTRATPDTLWFSGSTTKAFTAAAMGKIVQGHTSVEGVKWSTPLSRLLRDDFVLDDDFANSHLSLEDALSHRSGLPRHDNAYGWENASTTEVLRSMRSLPFSAQPRTRWQYNNMMFAAMGEVIQRLTEDSLQSILRKWLWEPLGMRSTTFDLDAALQEKDDKGHHRMSRGYHWNGDHYVPDRYIDIMPVAGAGSTISSVHDYSLWAKTLLDVSAGIQNASSPIDKKLWDTLTMPRSVVGAMPLGPHTPTYALGWIISTLDGHAVVSHGGGLPGFGTELFLMPDLGLGFVAMGNTVDCHEAEQLLFIEVLCRTGVVDCESTEEHTESLRQQAEPIKAGRVDVEELQSRRASEQKKGKKLPLPGKLSDYAGPYFHPGYGVFNVSLVDTCPALQTSTHASSQAPLLDDLARTITLRIDPSARTWDVAYFLTHSTHTFFDADVYMVHGTSEHVCDDSSSSTKIKGRNLQCRNEFAYDLMGDARVVFEFGKNGRVDRMGVEAEPELVRWAKEEGGKGNWREGMIWFEKI